MRRFKLVFVAALGIMGYVGAQAASGFNQTGTHYRRLGPNNYQALTPGQWSCENPTLDETCSFRRNTSAPISDANAERATSGELVID